MKKVLLVSPHPLSPTGRGMDVMTYCFASLGWETTHLQFPFYTFSNKNNLSDKNITRKSASLAWIPYIDSLMWWLPRPLFRLLQKYTSTKTRYIDFSHYDYIVLESGKPLFLLNVIPQSVKIIYRQSDSIKLVLGKGKHYCALEDEVCHRAQSIIIVKEYYKESIPKEDHHKITMIKNGYNIPHDLELENPYDKELNAVYVGLTPLDPVTLKAICEKYPKLSVHVFGSCLRGKRNIKKLTSLSNFQFHGFSPPSEYLAYLKFADLAIFPFKSWGAMKHVGFTSKFFNYMYFSLPIITYKTGDPLEFVPYNIKIANKLEDFLREVGYITDNPKKIDYVVDWDFYSKKGREHDYGKFINNLV